MTDTDPTAFDPARVADVARGRIPAAHLTPVQEAVRRAALEVARDEDTMRRVEAAHNLRLSRKQEAADHKKAEAERLASLPPAEFAAHIAARARRR